ncbi:MULTISPECIES: signal peptidase I [Bradyrhizobium]|jgi:signal peptidase I|uniref:Signal peptidase I n=1 Tax=Bradyrhizobium japonicum TaxID=375 RepID=A0ABV2RVU1_BRAJP|nr:signal peptidase I [Bradyrhizobium japonicum]AJA62362.1 signal peptidase I [Bradyrhizobium japonicum]KMJ96657.1 signal peptidase I [Bradyrhizobium japonicum]MBR0759139.1 signal peptidase I [Bradyrhizobium japonicum]MCS3541194.1 signal peptidase I [Bradyrhizobium japonicum]MCS3991623.1 signal peptidase I [Bradyrhizobium japonicum]
MTTLQQTIRPTARPREWKAIVVLILLIPVLWSPPFLFRFFLYQPFNIPSGSMAPTLMVGDYVFAAKYAYGYGRYSFPFAPSLISGRVFAAEPEHGDVVVFRTPRDTSVDYVKRVVGLPGDRIQMRQGQLFLNDRPVTRVALANGLAGTACGLDGSVKVKRWRETLPNGNSYITYDCVENGYYDNTNVYTVPPGHFFVLGDNRDNSSDSRVMANIGFVPMDNLVGRVTRIFWSLDEDGEPHMERLGKVW